MKEKFTRINSRISKEQHAFIKAQAKKLKMTEGELHRMIIEEYMKTNQ
jgi:hypothetical protein